MCTLVAVDVSLTVRRCAMGTFSRSRAASVEAMASQACHAKCLAAAAAASSGSQQDVPAPKGEDAALFGHEFQARQECSKKAAAEIMSRHDVKREALESMCERYEAKARTLDQNQ